MLKNVEELLKNFGKDWKNYSGVDLKFYSGIIDGVHDTVEIDGEKISEHGRI